jgi:alkanesulfonate monooxygenase SsuD/methylene tetrahydromethanopterin reductase-like flavin-dependent oxidoreductase (luciferase family)
MDVGMSLLFQNDGYLGSETDAAPGNDLEVYRRDIELARMAEPLGFDSLWAVEHHFTGYAMVPDTLQFLSFMAGQTTNIRLGSMVLVLPWHNPARVADAIAMLDNLCDGRFTLGIGRGVGKIEFEGMGVPMEESRERFVECAELVLDGLDQGFIEYAGKHLQQPKRFIRPAPTRTFRGRTYASAVSPESIEIMARLGVGLLLVPQKPWASIIEEVKTYREVYEQVNGEAAPLPLVCNEVFVDTDAARANELGALLIGDYYQTCLKHYELGGQHFQGMKGYEYYEKSAADIQAHDTETVRHWYTDLQVYGTPDQCVEKVAFIQESIGCAEFIGWFSYSGIPTEEAKRNVLLFTEEVMPRLRKL